MACHLLCVYRYHTALPYLRSVLRGVPGAGVVVGVWPLHQHAALQLHVCDDGHFQRRTPAGSVSLSAATFPEAYTTRRCLSQV